MLYKDFKAFSKIEQVEITLEQGVNIGRRLQYGDIMKLYQLGSFYVELLSARDGSEIFAIYSSDTDNLLEPYLKSIDLNELLKP